MDKINRIEILDRFATLIEQVGEVNRLLQNTNDWGDSTGYCQEADQLGNDAIRSLGSLAARAMQLRIRINRDRDLKEKQNEKTMNSLSAMANGMANKGNPLMVFDWEKAAKLIKDNKPKEASAGLSGDWGDTGGTIFRDGKIVSDDYTYLASTWATPELKMDGEIYDCFQMEGEIPWKASTKWPEEALKILS